jgi:hypothetical protein
METVVMRLLFNATKARNALMAALQGDDSFIYPTMI